MKSHEITIRSHENHHEIPMKSISDTTSTDKNKGPAFPSPSPWAPLEP